MHRPWSASQPLGHCGSQQSAPPQPWWHSHETGSPWSPGSEGMQVECASWATGGALMAPSAPSAPVDVFPAKRLTRPAEQRLPLQSKPPHGARHWHTLGAMHVPRPPQPAEHSGTSQRAPFQPASHAHRLAPMHLP